MNSARILNIKLYGLVLVALIVFSPGLLLADDITYTANFNSSTLDPNLTTYGQNSTFTVTSGGGELTLSKGATATAVSDSLGVVTNFAIPGDFVATADLSFSGVTVGNSSNSVGGSFIAQFPSGAFSQQGGFISGTGEDSAFGRYYNSAGQSPTLVVVPSASPVELEIERTGDTVTELYGPVGGSLTIIDSLTDSELDGPAVLNLNFFDSGTGTTAAESISFSDFQVTYSTPEPSSFILLLCGFILLGTFHRLLNTGVNRRSA